MAFNGFSSGTLGRSWPISPSTTTAPGSPRTARATTASCSARQRAFVDAVGAAFAAIDPRVQCVTRRSTARSSASTATPASRSDKSPYKTYSDLWFWIGDDRKTAPGYFVRIVPEGVWVGGGAHSLHARRSSRGCAQRSSAPASGGELEAMLGDLRRRRLRDRRADARARAGGVLGGCAHGPSCCASRCVHAIEKVSPAPPEFCERGVRGLVHGAVRAGQAARRLACRGDSAGTSPRTCGCRRPGRLGAMRHASVLAAQEALSPPSAQQSDRALRTRACARSAVTSSQSS